MHISGKSIVLLCFIGLVILVCGCTGTQVVQPTPQIVYVTVTPSPTPQIIYVTVTPQPTQAATQQPGPTTQPTTQVVSATPSPAASTPTTTPSLIPLPRRILVNVTAVNLHFTYKFVESDFFGPANQSLAGFVAKSGNITNYSITVTGKQSSIHSAGINSITVGPSGFSLLSMTSQQDLYMIEPSTSATITLSIQLPDSAYTGPLDVYIKVSEG